MFRSYYDAELSYLREVGRHFAAQYPSLAGMLGERGGDPDVERLLEGFAFIAAGLHQRIDDGVPELVESLAELLIPHALLPTPASTIVEFRGNPRALRGTVRLPAGTRLGTRAVEGTSCTFVTTRDVELPPMQLTAVKLDDSSSFRPLLRLTLALHGEGGGALLGSRLRLHLHGELPATRQLYLWFARHVTGLSIRDESGAAVELDARAVELMGQDNADTLFPWPLVSPHGPRLLLEQMVLPAKFLFIDLVGLERTRHLSGRTLELTIRFTNPPPLPARLAEDAVRLGCVPAVNVFEAGAEPVRLGLEQRPVLLRAAGMNPDHMEVFAVRSVVGVGKGSARRAYKPFQGLRPRRSGAAEGSYSLQRKRSPVDHGVNTFLRAHDRASDLEEETLSIELLCTNRSLPEHLQLGDICVPTSDVVSGVSFGNIAQVSPPSRPPLGSELMWSLLGQLSASRRTLADLEALKEYLCMQLPEERADHPVIRAYRRQVDAIRTVRARTITRPLRGAAVRGSLYSVEVEPGSFPSLGDAFLFGSVLSRVLTHATSLDTFSELELVLAQGSTSFHYRAELG